MWNSDIQIQHQPSASQLISTFYRVIDNITMEIIMNHKSIKARALSIREGHLLHWATSLLHILNWTTFKKHCVLSTYGVNHLALVAPLKGKHLKNAVDSLQKWSKPIPDYGLYSLSIYALNMSFTSPSKAQKTKENVANQLWGFHPESTEHKRT